MMRCPYCHDAVGDRVTGVRCARCGAPHHRACWAEHGKCAIGECGTTASLELSATTPARVVLRATTAALKGALVDARERLGGKSVVALFLLSCTVTGLGVAPLLYRVHASRKVEIEVLLAALFVLLVAWISALLYRGSHVHDDLDVSVGRKSLQDYFIVDPSKFGGCTDPGCGGGDVEGILAGLAILAAIVILVVFVLPLVAWLALEIVFPIVVLGTYGTLYYALAFAVNGQQELAGKTGRCIARAVGYAAIYTGIVALVLFGSAAAFRKYAPPAEIPAEAPVEKPR